MTMISTRTISKLAPPDALARIGQSAAMLDALLFPDDWDERYFSFDAKWGRGERVFSMRNGEGDFWFLWLARAGAVLHGFAHESAMSPWSRQRSKEVGAPKPFPGLFAGFPKALAYKKTAASFCEDKNEVTFVAWSLGGARWTIGDVAFPKGSDPDGSKDLLFILDGNAETYAKWAKRYVGRAVPLAAVKKIYLHAPLTNELARAINPEADFAAAKKEAKSIGYP